MRQAVQGFNEQLERIAEVVVVLSAGAMLVIRILPDRTAWFVLVLFVLARPLAVWFG